MAGLTIAELLGELDLEHLGPALASETTGSLRARLADGRPALLAHLKGAGVKSLPERQAVAGALAKAVRAGRIVGEWSTPGAALNAIATVVAQPPAAPSAASPPAAAHAVMPDGRRVGYREYGDPSGTPILFFHGCGNSRHFSPCFERTDAVTAAAGARVIAIDRPGVGTSDAHAARTYASSAADALDVADSLGLGPFAALGYSSGGPCALACAAHAPEGRVLAVGLISSDGPYAMMRREPAGAFDAPVPPACDDAEAYALAEELHTELRSAYASRVPDGPRRAACLADLDAATTRGVGSMARDFILERRDAGWGFDLTRLAPPVHIWHGDADTEVHVQSARYIAAHLDLDEVEVDPVTESGDQTSGRAAAVSVDGAAGGVLRVVRRGGHAMVRQRWGAILAELLDAARRRSRM